MITIAGFLTPTETITPTIPEVNSSSYETHTGESEIRTVECVYLYEHNCYRDKTRDKYGDTHEKGESRIWRKFPVIQKTNADYKFILQTLIFMHVMSKM